MPNFASYTVKLEPLEEGGFMVTVPVLPGCFSYGENQATALANASEAIGLHVEGLIQHGQPVPRETEHHQITAIIQVPLKASA